MLLMDVINVVSQFILKKVIDLNFLKLMEACIEMEWLVRDRIGKNIRLLI